MPENPASYRVVRTKSYLFNKAAEEKNVMNTRGLILIIIGAMFECAWAFGLKHAQGPFEIFLTVVCVVASFGIFMLSFKYVGASIAYVVYTGLGTLFVVLVEMADTVSHGGQPEILRIVFVVTLMLGVIGVKGAKS
ncbi:multidrug efflux SMR transporter [Klebsiella pneumoniae]|uniref:DMT family transporter n=4 Tax=Klebsiella/Raoultella group TaxID=2890311 RepID=UPI002175C988|nr:SMR family transporter [Klebsiella pneumoniae]MCS5439179.1 SMR family transporter [Klebsiella pneumoniae]